jgi:hypothetical protein
MRVNKGDAMKHEAEQLLRRAGWSPERRVETGDMTRALASEGYAVSPLLEGFLAEYGNLLVLFPRRFAGRPDTVNLNASRAASGIYKEAVDEYGHRIGKAVVPVGTVYSDHMTMLLADDGSVYGGFDDTLVFFGKSPAEGLETILTEADTEPVP